MTTTGIETTEYTLEHTLPPLAGYAAGDRVLVPARRGLCGVIIRAADGDEIEPIRGAGVPMARGGLLFEAGWRDEIDGPKVWRAVYDVPPPRHVRWRATAKSKRSRAEMGSIHWRREADAARTICGMAIPADAFAPAEGFAPTMMRTWACRDCMRRGGHARAKQMVTR